MTHPLRSLLATLLAALALAGFAESETRFAIYAYDGSLVGTGKVEIESDDREAEVDLLRGFAGFVRVVVADGAGGFIAYDGVIAPGGALTVIVASAFLDLREFLATFGDGGRFELDLEFESRFDGDRDPFRSDDGGRRGDDDEDDDRDDDRDDRDDDDRDDDRDDRDDDDDRDDRDDDRDDDDDDDDDDEDDDDEDDDDEDDDDEDDDDEDDDDD